jgi:peptidoglycan-associated lipoprotein
MKRTIIAAGMLATMVAGCGWTPGMRDRADLVVEPSACAPTRFEVYFAEGEARLTQPALQTIGLTATQLQGCEIRSVNVVGLSDAQGGAVANQTLSERRAVAVAEALAAAGWPRPAFEVHGVGDQGATTTDGANEPMRRRTEVVVDAAPRA